MAVLYSRQEIRELEKLAIAHGVSGCEMMVRAGHASFNALKKCYEDLKSILVLCGTGNNGGDGFVLARLAHEAGLTVYVRHVSPLTRVKGETLSALNACRKAGVDIASWHEEERLVIDVVVDAMLGIGLEGDLKPDVEQVIEAVNITDIPVFAIDVPSGIIADTGMPAGNALKAEHTITFIGMKKGFLTGLATEYCGFLFCHDLGLPDELFEQVSHSAIAVNAEVFEDSFGPRPRFFHKGDCGSVLVVGGAPGMSGAPILCALGAARVGAGLVTIATHPDHANLIALSQPEIMCHGVSTIKQLDALVEQADVVVIGPGLGQNDWAKRMLKSVLAYDVPIVMDADALNLIAKQQIKNDDWVLTPHPGEAARLLKSSTDKIQENRFKAVKALKKKYGGTVVLKGSGTIIGTDVLPLVCSEGNPGMASGGMGDLLTGIIAGICAQGLELSFAATLGVCIHAGAADIVAEEFGERGMLATDLLPYVWQLMNML